MVPSRGNFRKWQDNFSWQVGSQLQPRLDSIKNLIGPYQRTPKQVARAIRYPGLGVRSVGPVGDFLD